MKYLVFLSMLISFVCYADNHKKNHHHDHDHHNDHEQKKEKKSLKAHEHGVGILNIAQEGQLLVFEFELPGYDVVGFEYKAKRKEDIKKIKKAIGILSNYKSMIKINSDAGCKVNASNANLLEEGNHTEFRSQYILDCSNIYDIGVIETYYFKNFQNSEKLKVNIVSTKQTDTLELSPDNYKIEMQNYF